METAPNSLPERPNKSKVPKPAQIADYADSKHKVTEIKSAEAEAEITDFLELNEISDSQGSRQLVKKLLTERRAFDPGFSLVDFTEPEITRIRKQASLKQSQREWSENKGQAMTAEGLVDQWKESGLSNYEVLQKIIAAHDNGEVRLLASKVVQFKQFLSLLQNQQFSQADTSRIIEVVNQGAVDFNQPDAFDQMIFSIYEDEGVSKAAKDKICQKFKLFPIHTGNDLNQNLKIKQTQVKTLKRQRIEANESLRVLNHRFESLEAELAELKKQVLAESDLDKRLILEKQYDLLERRFTTLKKERDEQNKVAEDLNDKTVSSKVYLRGVEAKMKEGRIFIQLPKSNRSLSVPSNLGNEAIASTVNAYLVNDILIPLGLEQYFFYQSDFTGDFPHPTSIEKNDLFLYRLGLAKEGQILSKTDLKELRRLLNKLMVPEEYQVDKTLHQNAEIKLSEFGILEDRGLNNKQFVTLMQRQLLQ